MTQDTILGLLGMQESNKPINKSTLITLHYKYSDKYLYAWWCGM